MTEKTPENQLTTDDDLLNVFMRQIRDKAYTLGYGNLTVEFKVRGRQIKEAHITAEVEKLRPF